MKKIILSVALLATGVTSSYAMSVADEAKYALIDTANHTVAGTFGAYDFAPKGDKNKFDWAFTTASGDIYQLRGGEASATDVFGWAKAPTGTVAPEPAWYMFQVDVDGDGMGKFDWVLLAANGKSAYKLDGVADDGGFAYAGPIDIDYKIVGTKITTGPAGTLGDSAIIPNNLSGKTAFVEDKNNISMDTKEWIYIFESDTKVKVVINRNDGGQLVYENGTYKISKAFGMNAANINIVTGESSSVGYTLFLDDDYNPKEDQLGAFVTKFVDNANNGVIIKESTTQDDELTIHSPDDIKGYTITTIVGHPGTTGATMQLTAAFNCDGTVDYRSDFGFSGVHAIDDYHGNEIRVDDTFATSRISWRYVDEDGDATSGLIQTNSDYQLLEGGCWSSANADGTCTNDLEIESITGSGCN